MMIKYQTLFEDEDIVVVIKPAGILSQGDASNSPDMVSLLKGSFAIRDRREGKKTSQAPYLAVVHRLDRGVRGIMVYAKTKMAAAHLSAQIQRGDFEKIYMAVLERKEGDGLEKSNDFTHLVSYLSYEKTKNLSFSPPDGKGDKCELAYAVLDLIETKALVKIRLLTGRKHQIRVQMREISHGIYGDRKYNSAGTFVSRKEEIALQCVSLAFFHPKTGERLCFQIEPVGTIFSSFNH